MAHMGIAPLPEEPFVPANLDEEWVSPLAQKKPRESEGYEAFEEELEGDEGPYGSLVMFRPKSFKKKPVLTVDPDELEKAYQAFDVCGAQIMDGEDAPITRHGTQFLGLAPIEEGEEAIEGDDDLVADDDLDRLLQDAIHADEGAEPAGAEPAGAESDDVPPPPPDLDAGPEEAGPDDAGPEEAASQMPAEAAEDDLPVESRSQSADPADLAPEAPEMPAPEPLSWVEQEGSAGTPDSQAAREEAPTEPASEPARPSFSLPEFRSEPEEENDMPRGEGWSLVPPESADHQGADYFVEEPAEVDTNATSHYYDDEEDVFDPFAEAQPRRLAHVQETGTRSQLRARLMREEQAKAEAAKTKFSFFGWLRSLFG